MKDNDTRTLNEMYDEALNTRRMGEAIGATKQELLHMIELLEGGDLVFSKDSVWGRAKKGEKGYAENIKKTLQQFADVFE